VQSDISEAWSSSRSSRILTNLSPAVLGPFVIRTSKEIMNKAGAALAKSTNPKLPKGSVWFNGPPGRAPAAAPQLSRLRSDSPRDGVVISVKNVPVSKANSPTGITFGTIANNDDILAPKPSLPAENPPSMSGLVKSNGVVPTTRPSDLPTIEPSLSIASPSPLKQKFDIRKLFQSPTSSTPNESFHPELNLSVLSPTQPLDNDSIPSQSSFGFHHYPVYSSADDRSYLQIAQPTHVDMSNGEAAQPEERGSPAAEELFTHEDEHDENLRREKALDRRENAIRQMEQNLKTREEVVWQREEAAERMEGVVMLREQEVTVKARELQQLADELDLREETIKAKEAELEKLRATAQESAMMFNLRSIFLDTTARHYRRLLKCRGADAQTILDAFQSVRDVLSLHERFSNYIFVKLLDAGTFSERRQLVVAMRRLSARTQLYPQRYVLDGPVELVHNHPVDSGKYADIYKANFRGQLTCLKVIRAHTASLVQHMAKVYAREAILWGQLSHPNLLPFYGLHFFRSQVAFVAPWAEKGNLNDYLSREPNANRVLLCADAAAGVDYLHANEIVHGDLKALNVLVDGSGRACLSDFGLSGVADKEIIKWATQSSAASKGGTSRWQAPELHNPEILNIHNTKESDIFAWASTCYEVFTGNAPFYEISRETTVALMILRGDLPTRPRVEDRSWTERGLTEGLWKLFLECWSMDATQRPKITAVISRLAPEQPAEDPRPPGQWELGLSMRFRNAQDTATHTHAHPSSSLENLDEVLSKVMGDSEDLEVDLPLGSETVGSVARRAGDLAGALE
ncbi:hypothetical protein H0H87_012670, partial [Tephrocybe sp. NHM501043]